MTPPATPLVDAALANALEQANVGDVHIDDTSRADASHDASLFELKPRAVVAPRDARDVERLVKFATDHVAEGIQLTARSAGTDMTGGPLTKSVVVRFTDHFTHIRSIANGQAVVEPGVYYRDFERATLKENLLLPSFPASREICTVGGMANNNSGGERSLVYGKTNQYIESLKVVLADGKEHTLRALSEKELAKKKQQNDFEGKLYQTIDALLTKHAKVIAAAKPKVSKNSAGYALWNVRDETAKTFDLTQLICGAQGTLGLTTEITFRLVEPKKFRRMLVMFLPNFDHLANVALKLKQFNPETIESYDDHTFKVALRFLPELARELGTSAFTIARQFLPEAAMILRGGIPKLVVMAEFAADSQHEANTQADKAKLALKGIPGQVRVVATKAESNDFWEIRRDSFNLLRHKIHKLHTAPFIDDLIVPPAAMPEFLPRLYQLLDKEKLLVTVAGHIGDGNFHIIPLMDVKKPATKQIIESLTPKVYNLVFSYGGSMTGEHNDGLIRSSFLKDMFGAEIYRLFEATKQAFDPKGIFNPGKKIGVVLDESLKHMRTTW